jgi:hypothetical protein
MKGTYGDLIDYSSEMSNKREEKCGTEDPIKRKYFNEYKTYVFTKSQFFIIQSPYLTIIHCTGK